MYEFDWGNTRLWGSEAPVGAETRFDSKLPRNHVAETMLVHWEEHCIECAPPQCYEVCPLYVRRDDSRCARFVYGLYPNRAFSGLFDHGADVRFRRWGKIETKLNGRSTSVALHRALDRTDSALTSIISTTSRALTPLTGRRRLNAAWAHVRESLVRLPARGRSNYDDFIVECYYPDSEPCRLILEYLRDGAPSFRHAFEIRPGHNFHKVPARAFAGLDSGLLRLYPDEDREPRLIFTWLDFVKYADGVRRPASKVKVVAWDLDNTLWHGTLLEDGPDGCALREGVPELIKALDARGVLQTVVSKNDFDSAWPLIERFALEEFFLYPAINWGQKSESLRQIAERLNLGIDSFALVDDSPFERAEVSSALPTVRTYSPDELATLLELDEFDVPSSETSANRRMLYLKEMERDQAREQFRGDYADFLRSCEMQVRIFAPSSDSQRRRCYELLRRSNQLNLSARRYSEQEFEELLSSPGILPLAVEANDRFGNYGIVGFASVDETTDSTILRDLVLSCRIAGKHVEQTLFHWLAQHAQARGHSSIQAELARTDRNGPLIRALEELQFDVIERREDRELIALRNGNAQLDDVVSLTVDL